MLPYSIKDLPEIFEVGITIRAILADNVSGFASITQHHFFREKDTPCDAIMENNFPWQHRWIPFRGENFDMFFIVPIVPIKLVPAYTNSLKLEKASLLPGHLCVQEEKV